MLLYYYTCIQRAVFDVIFFMFTVAQRRGGDVSEGDEDERETEEDDRDTYSSNRQDTDSEHEEEQEANITLPKGKIGKKKAAKLEAKAERQAQRLSEERAREEQKERDAIQAEEDKKIQEDEVTQCIYNLLSFSLMEMT